MIMTSEKPQHLFRIVKRLSGRLKPRSRPNGLATGMTPSKALLSPREAGTSVSALRASITSKGCGQFYRRSFKRWFRGERHLKNEYKCKKWANSELIAAISQIDSTEFPDKHRFAVRLRNHTYVADQIFKADISGEKHSFTWVNTNDTPTLDDLSSNIKKSDEWLCDYVDSASEEELSTVISFTFTDGDKGNMTIHEILSHLLIHGAYHRGNIGMVLGDCGVDKTNDIFTRFLHESEPSRRN
jgi:uncharacterized damage-inducible protein DinB